MQEIVFKFEVYDDCDKIFYGETKMCDFTYEEAYKKLDYRLDKIKEIAPTGIFFHFKIKYIGNNALELLETHLINAISKYSEDNIDIFYSKDCNEIDVMYHDDCNSFVIESFNPESFDCSYKELIALADKLNCGHCNLSECESLTKK